MQQYGVNYYGTSFLRIGYKVIRQINAKNTV